MAHFAQMDGDTVIGVIVVNNETIQNLEFPDSEPVGVAFCHSLYGNNTLWRQTSYNGNFRGCYAGIGYTYDPVLDIFVPPKSPDTFVAPEPPAEPVP